jgi:sporulation integral membrane protein YlbJ
VKYFVIYKLKEIIYILVFLIFLLVLISLSKENLYCIKNSTDIFFANILPSLFPFIFFTEFILNTEIINILSKYFGKFISKIFNCNRNSTPAIIIGFLCGFPMGAKTVTTLYSRKKINKKEASILLMFVNNCNPAFLVSTIGVVIFNDLKIGFILLISQYLSSIIYGMLISNNFISSIILKKSKNLNTFVENINILGEFSRKNEEKLKKRNNISFFDNINQSITNTFKTLSMIFGFIILFNLFFNFIKIILEQLNLNYTFINVLSGLFEITSGTINIFNTNIPYIYKICLISFVLSFSGLCILFQIYSIIYKYKFSLKNIIYSKFIQGIFSCILTYILLNIFNIQEKTTTIFRKIENINTHMNISYDEYIHNIKEAYLNSTLIIVAFLCIYMIISILRNKEHLNK